MYSSVRVNTILHLKLNTFNCRLSFSFPFFLWQWCLYITRDIYTITYRSISPVFECETSSLISISHVVRTIVLLHTVFRPVRVTVNHALLYTTSWRVVKIKIRRRIFFSRQLRESLLKNNYNNNNKIIIRTLTPFWISVERALVRWIARSN